MGQSRRRGRGQGGGHVARAYRPGQQQPDHPAYALSSAVGAGSPAKPVTRWMAPALPVFAGKPAPTGIAPDSKN
ncbi:hypothetical protein DMX06_23945 [Pseudomonas mosselii]|nr:hypothetical protein DMX06_23945 [Pseudomonas mosselii]